MDKTMNRDAEKENTKAQRRGNALRACAFILIFALLFLKVQDIITPNRDLPENDIRTQKNMSGLLNEAENTIDVIWLGTSHVHFGISPMEIYRNSGIRSHLITKGYQHILPTYYLLKEAMKKQTPKVVAIDASNLFHSLASESSIETWMDDIDVLPLTSMMTRIQMARKATELRDEEFDDTYINMSVLPLLQYHDNYSTLTEADYADMHLEQLYHRKGFVASKSVTPADPANEEEIHRLLYGTGEEVYSLYDDTSLAQNLRDNREGLELIQNLCREKGSELVFIKVPVHLTTAHKYGSYWSYEKSTLVQQMADELGIRFFDFNYVDYGIDWQTDSTDGGDHLNLAGATKTSRYLADWLVENFDFDGLADAESKARWDAQLALYDWEMKYFRLRMEEDVHSYFDEVAQRHYTVFASVSGNVADFWTDELQALFTQLTGCESDLRDPGNAALALISRDGSVLDMANSPESCELIGELEDGAAYHLGSYPRDAEANVKLRVNHATLSSEFAGVQLAFYDEELGFAADSRTLTLDPETGEIVLQRNSYSMAKFYAGDMNYIYDRMKSI